MKTFFSIILLSAIFISCHSSKKSIGTSGNASTENQNLKKLKGAWELETLFASDNKWAKTPYLDFDINEKAVSGFSGCNAIRGKFTTAAENLITFDKNFITTKMACADPAVNKTEKVFLSVLPKINKYAATGDEMELSQGEIVLMKFKRKKQ